MYYTVNDVRLNVVDEGKGNPALVFLHFYGGSSQTWAGVAEALRDEYRVIRYDHRGWGKSDKPSSGYSIVSLAKDALALIDALQLDEYILIGHSMGGKVAQYVAAQRPKGLKQLLLVAPSPSSATILPEEALEGMKMAYTSRDRIEAVIDHVFLAAELDGVARERLIADMQQHNDHSRLGWIEIAMKEDFSAEVGRIDVPVLVIAGEKDVVDTPERLETEVVGRISGARMAVVPGVGHLSMVQKPAAVAELIREFVRS